MQTIFAGSQGSSNFTYQKTFLQQVVTSATLTSIPDPNALCRRNFVTEFRYGCLSSVWPDWAFLKNVLVGKFSFKSSQNICWLLGYSKNITFWIKTVVTNFWATFKITGLLCILFLKKKWAIPGLFLFIFVFSIQLIINKCSIKFCRWLESNRGPLVSNRPLYQTSHNHFPTYFVFLHLSFPQ